MATQNYFLFPSWSPVCLLSDDPRFIPELSFYKQTRKLSQVLYNCLQGAINLHAGNDATSADDYNKS